ncbi:UNVERIFIED_CONTAM: hypothetical protein Q9R58_26025 [Methylobacteriaceae bacterium AG10]|jgi:hypothetical protein|nr:hypothetical protein [Methylobacteriaceae bacterium AG10]
MPAPASAAGPAPAARASRRSRSRAAAGRLEAARRGFERSLITLRRAALDAVDSGNLASLTLRLCCDPRLRARTEGTA